MKALKKIFTLILAITMLLPLTVMAEEEKKETATTKEPVKIYMFHGSTCQYCQNALKWFDSIKEEYGNYFELITYEVWNDAENAELMEEVSSFLGDNATGVPYIILGKYTYPNGFAADSKVSSSSDETMGDQLITRIKEIYNSDERYDVMYEINNKPDYSLVVGIISGVVIVGITAFAIISRKQNQ